MSERWMIDRSRVGASRFTLPPRNQGGSRFLCESQSTAHPSRPLADIDRWTTLAESCLMNYFGRPLPPGENKRSNG
jgi:hypothetical protein